MSSRRTSVWPYALVLAGGVAFAAGIVLGLQAWSWGALVTGVLFWLGVAQGQVIFRAMVSLSKGKWSRPFQPMMQSGATFVSWGTTLLLLMLLAHRLWLPAAELSPRKAAWLSGGALLVRDGGLAVALAWLSRRFVGGASQTIHRPGQAAGLILFFALTYSLLAFDLIAIPSGWESTLFGAYFFVGTVLGGMAMTLLVTYMRPAPQVPSIEAWHDFSTLFFGFSCLWAYLFWSQYLTIWFGNLPRETDFVVRRLWEAPWAPVSWSAGLCLWGIPFLTLIAKEPKRHPGFLAAVAALVLLGLLLERAVLVLPLVVTPRAVSPAGTALAVLILAALGGVYWISIEW